jgi:hypothetical protein
MSRPLKDGHSWRHSSYKGVRFAPRLREMQRLAAAVGVELAGPETTALEAQQLPSDVLGVRYGLENEREAPQGILLKTNDIGGSN